MRILEGGLNGYGRLAERSRWLSGRVLDYGRIGVMDDRDGPFIRIDGCRCDTTDPVQSHSHQLLLGAAIHLGDMEGGGLRRHLRKPRTESDCPLGLLAA